MTLRIYGDSRSGNCLKVKWTAEKLGLPYEWVEVDIKQGTTRQVEFLALNPAGQVPLAILEDGRALSQSNAIILYLAEGSNLVPRDAYARAKMYEWLFWEQYSHEPYIAVARWQVVGLGKRVDEIEERIVKRGTAALERLDLQLEQTPFLVEEHLSLADVALVAYTRVAHEGGFDMALYPAIQAWVIRVEAGLRIGD
jgi:glutathione S-transferase